MIQACHATESRHAHGHPSNMQWATSSHAPWSSAKLRRLLAQHHVAPCAANICCVLADVKADSPGLERAGHKFQEACAGTAAHGSAVSRHTWLTFLAGVSRPLLSSLQFPVKASQNL